MKVICKIPMTHIEIDEILNLLAKREESVLYWHCIEY